MIRYMYSFIIPHRNSPALLQRCIDSIPRRDDIQIIIVDDDSDSNVVDFNNFPGSKSENVEIVFCKQNRGAGFARNLGLQKAKGEWIFFADSDDYYDTDNLLELMNRDYSCYDAVVWSYVEKKDSRAVSVQLDSLNKQVDLLFTMNQPWRMMRKLSVIEKNHIKFQESMISNDIMFSRKFAYYCKSFAVFEKCIYHWVRRSDSISSSYGGAKLREALNVSIDVNCYLKKINKIEYFDCTFQYLAMLWKESKISYWYYLLVVYFRLGYKIASDTNRKVCEKVLIKPKIKDQILDEICVELGYVKRNLISRLCK